MVDRENVVSIGDIVNDLIALAESAGADRDDVTYVLAQEAAEIIHGLLAEIDDLHLQLLAKGDEA